MDTEGGMFLMQYYKIVVTAYKENGSLGDYVCTKYCENIEEAKNICQDYERQRQKAYSIDAVTGETVETSTNMRAYKVDLYVLCYKEVQNKQTLFDMY